MTLPRAPLALIVAMTAERVIGRGGSLPWRIAEDLRHFRRVTTGHAIIVGRRTYESIGRPLPERRNIVVSRTPGFGPPGCEVAPTVERAIELARETDKEPIVIGGAELYAAAMPYVARMYVTRVPLDVDGDTFFPAFEPAEWRETERTEGEAATFVTLERI